MTVSLDAADDAAIRSHFASYSRAWRLNDPEMIVAHWSAEQFRFYKAEEIDRFFLAWSEVGDYFRHNAQFHELVDQDYLRIDLVPVSADLVVALVRMRWDIQFAADAKLPDGSPFSHRGKSMGGDDHVLTLLARTAAGWKLTGWSETPDAPITYMTRLYLGNVKPGFPPPNSRPHEK